MDSNPNSQDFKFNINSNRCLCTVQCVAVWPTTFVVRSELVYFKVKHLLNKQLHVIFIISSVVRSVILDS